MDEIRVPRRLRKRPACLALGPDPCEDAVFAIGPAELTAGAGSLRAAARDPGRARAGLPQRMFAVRRLAGIVWIPGWRRAGQPRADRRQAIVTSATHCIRMIRDFGTPLILPFPPRTRSGRQHVLPTCRPMPSFMRVRCLRQRKVSVDHRPQSASSTNCQSARDSSATSPEGDRARRRARAASVSLFAMIRAMSTAPSCPAAGDRTGRRSSARQSRVRGRYSPPTMSRDVDALPPSAGRPQPRILLL